jgi:hypothetical protein
MSYNQPMEIDEPTPPLDSETGAIALLVTDIQPRDEIITPDSYSDSDPDYSSRPSTPFPDPLRRIRSSTLTKTTSPHHVKKIPAPPDPNTYIFIRTQSEDLIKKSESPTNRTHSTNSWKTTK